MGWLSASNASNAMKDEVGRTTLQLVNQNHVTLEKTLSSVNDKMITLLDNHFFSDSVQYRFWTSIETLGQISEADSILERWDSDGTDYTLFMKNKDGRNTPFDLAQKVKGFKYFGENNVGLPDWAKEALTQKGGGSLRLAETNEGAKTVIFIRNITNPKYYEEVIGLLVVSNLEVLLTRDLVSVQMPKDAGSFLFNRQDDLLMKAGTLELDIMDLPKEAERSTSGYYFSEEEDGNWLYAYSRRSAFGTTLIYKIPYASITGNQTLFQWTMMAVAAIYLTLVLAFVLYLLRIIVKPLLRLVSITKIYEPGKKLKIDHHELHREDEFGLLYGSFMKMTRRLDHSIEENYGMKIKQKEHELSMLHSQITPHLLYNTLDSIYWYALDSGNTNVGNMVKDLSKLLRIGLSKGRTIITIEEELEHVQAYSRLQMKRYPDTFEVEWVIDEELKSHMTPKVILQPLVENAIFHGVSSMDGEGIIRIEVLRIDTNIQMSVEDNGFLPIDMDRLEQIVKGEATDKGYGIRNVHQRVQLHYGEAYGLTYEKREEGGLRAVITIPMREQ